MEPATRREIEHKLLHVYYETLTASDRVTSYSYEDCYADYVSGGACRWIWLLMLLSAMCPDKMVQTFHDQVLHFLRDHNVTPETIAMPRV